jgi:lysozyme family protein
VADFLRAYRKTSVAEGGYANDKDDSGGETWKGIARRKHPEWEGWLKVDYNRKYNGFPGSLKSDIALEESVQTFYALNFWNRILGDKIKAQGLADAIYDSAVNMGPTQAIKLIQDAAFSLPEDSKKKLSRIQELQITYGYMDHKTLASINNEI